MAELVSIKRNVDVSPGQAAPAVFHCSQGDVGSKLILGLLNNGTAYSIPSGVTVTIEGSESNGSIFTPISATASGSDITFYLTGEMTAVAGPAICQAVLKSGSNILGTANFAIEVESSPMGADAPPVFTDAGWTWMLNKLTTEIVPALGDDVISAIESKADQSDLTALSNTVAGHTGSITVLNNTVNTLNGDVTENRQNIALKLDKNQGTTNAGKYLKVGSDGNVETAELDVTTDKTLSITDKAADAKAVGDELDDLKADLAHITSSAVPTTVRQAIKTLFETGGYADTGLTDEMAVISSWALQVTAITLNQTSISLNGSATSQLVATTTPTGGTVTWSSSDTSVATVSSNGLVTGVGNGTATITATSGDVSATCTATISGFKNLVSISAVYTQSGTVYDTDSLDDLKADLVVTGLYDDQSTETITNYTLSGTLEVGTSTIVVSYGGKTTTFNVTVTEARTITYEVEYRGNYTVGEASNTRVTLITGDVTFNPGDVVTLNIADGYRYYVLEEVSTGSDTALNRTAKQQNQIYVISSTSSGYVHNKNETLISSASYVRLSSNNTWFTNSRTLTYNANQTNALNLGGLSFFVEKVNEEEITVAEAEAALTITLPQGA